MELTWDMAGQYLFLAGLFASVLGLGKVFVIMTVIIRHLKKATGKPADYSKGRKKAVSLTIVEGLSEMIVGVVVMAFVGLVWKLDNEGRSVVMAFGVVLFVLTLVLYALTNSWMKDLEQERATSPY